MAAHLMIDLETLGTTPDAVILSIGAVFFDVEGIKHRAEWILDAQSQIKGGRKIEAATLTWWLKQSPEAQETLKTSLQSGMPMREAIEGFLQTCREFGGPDVRVWGNGANFDVVLMEHLLGQMKIDIPWKFWNVRCYRTLKSCHPIDENRARQGVHHRAVDDAVFQAEGVLVGWKYKYFKE